MQTHGGKGQRVLAVSGEPLPGLPPRALSESPGTALAWGLDALASQGERGALSGPVQPSGGGISGSPALWRARSDLTPPQCWGPGPCPSPPPILTTLSSGHPAYVTGPLQVHAASPHQGPQPPQLPPQPSGQAGSPISPKLMAGPQEHRGTLTKSTGLHTHTSDAHRDYRTPCLFWFCLEATVEFATMKTSYGYNKDPSGRLVGKTAM